MAVIRAFVAAVIVLDTIVSSIQAADPSAQQIVKHQNVSVRLAVSGFDNLADTQEIQSHSRILADLLTVRLSQVGKFELVERQEIDAITDEISLSLSQLTKPSEAIKVGKLLRADWLVLGSTIRANSTKYIVVKIVDARTGIIRDLTAFSLEGSTPNTQAAAIADFVRDSTDPASPSEQRVFFGVGGFEDLSINNRYPDLGRSLRAFLEMHFRRGHYAVVERAIVEPLFSELRLNLSALTENPSASVSAQPAFLLVDGAYQSYQDAEAKINLILRIQEIGGSQKLYPLKGPPGNELNEQIAGILEGSLRDLRQSGRKASRKEEAQTQVARGIERSRVRNSERNHFFLGGYGPGSDDEKRLKNITEAIEAFQTALLLDPDNPEAKLDLAICLMDPAVGKKEAARDCLSELIAGCPDASMVHAARRELARSYLKENDRQALDLFLGLEKETVAPVERAELFEEILEAASELRRKGTLATTESTSLWDSFFLAQCATIEYTNCHPVLLMSPRYISQWFALYLWNCQTNQELAIAHFDRFLSTVVEAHPSLSPHLWSGYVLWRSFNSHSVPADLAERLRKAWEFCRDQPRNVARLVSLKANYLPEMLEWSACRSEYQTGEVLAQIVHQVRSESSQESTFIQRSWAGRSRGSDKVLYYAGYCDRGLSHWKEALEDFQAAQKQADSVILDLDGPWGARGTRIHAQELIAECESHLASVVPVNLAEGKPTHPKSPLKFELGTPVRALGEPTVFACDGDCIWLTDGFAPFVYNKSDDSLRDLDWPTVIERNVTSICPDGGTVWWGTDGSGLVEMDKVTRRCRVYSEKDNLLLSQVTALAVNRDKLWIAFGRQLSGGIGYLDLPTRTFVGLTPDLEVASVTNRVIPWASPQLTAPPRSSVCALFPSSSGELWFLLKDYGLGCYSISQSRWFSFPHLQLAVSQWKCLAATSNYVAMGGCGWESGLVIHDILTGNATEVELRDVLSIKATPRALVVSSVAVDGNRLWVGGTGFLAVVDPDSKGVEAVCDFDPTGTLCVRRLEVQGDGVWAAIGKNLYCFHGFPTRKSWHD